MQYTDGLKAFQALHLISHFHVDLCGLNSALLALARGRWQLSLQLLESMEPDLYSYNSILGALKWQQSLQLLERMLQTEAPIL